MRRAAAIAALVTAVLLIASPAQAFAHNNVHNAFLHAVLDGLTLLIVTAPVWTAYFWGAARRGLLVALVAVVQIPVAIIGFSPIDSPALHLTAMLVALALTAFSLWSVRRASRAVVADRVAESG
ncbi:hypothetical protein O7635_36935 [Asanoa sp. WMMD1127]|uniref:hypothetical protein n=1 Tax=Asanoa sp. WMMD1127 TaxID=3016107 RepID=UPI002417EED0|nr:hypothetical protein [Asanoa sp. WMMD1127]MDG4827462.1 hypothetical protein [Asanoa sp. WMMD1127]